MPRPTRPLADLSLKDPIVNALALVFTAATAHALGQGGLTWRTAAGSALILLGVGVCVAANNSARALGAGGPRDL